MQLIRHLLQHIAGIADELIAPGGGDCRGKKQGTQ